MGWMNLGKPMMMAAQRPSSNPTGGIGGTAVKRLIGSARPTPKPLVNVQSKPMGGMMGSNHPTPLMGRMGFLRGIRR